MTPEIECIPCLVQQAYRIIALLGLPESTGKKVLKEVMSMLIDQDFDKPTPYYSQKIWKIIQNYTHDPDPYKDIRHHFNQKMKERSVQIEGLIQESAMRFRTAVKTAITGNIIDFGSKHPISEDSILNEISSINSKPLYLDDHKKLRSKIRSAENLLYLGDNCGEIVFDKLFIKEIKKLNPSLKVTFVVRGGPILNDVIISDADQVHMEEVARIIDNGFDAPGTQLAQCSAGFLKEFDAADLIISKGQGNYESLSDAKRRDIFFLFMVKCEAVAKQTGAARGSLVCLHNKK
ncbi:MAG: ARMT1-like domain-containing protein [Bacteroidales bacterium]